MIVQLEKHKAGLSNYFTNYQQVVDKKAFEQVLSAYYNNVNQAEIPNQIKVLYNKHKGDFKLMADEIFEKSMFVSEERLVKFLDNYKASHWKKIEKDPAMKLAVGLWDNYYNNYLPGLRAAGSRVDSLMRHYMQAQMEMQPMKNFYPDANFTLRVAYGNVDGFSPDDAKNYRFFTTLDGIMEKEDPAIYDYVVEDKLKELYNNEDYGPYSDADGSMHVCFIATNHTTGGNSGSPVLDADGNLIGLNFDRCWEGTMSDLMYDPKVCRNISIDIRYFLFVVDKFAGAGYLVEEMDLVK